MRFARLTIKEADQSFEDYFLPTDVKRIKERAGVVSILTPLIQNPAATDFWIVLDMTLQDAVWEINRALVAQVAARPESAPDPDTLVEPVGAVPCPKCGCGPVVDIERTKSPPPQRRRSCWATIYCKNCNPDRQLDPGQHFWAQTRESNGERAVAAVIEAWNNVTKAPEPKGDDPLDRR
jgi:hypothetical protein